MDSNPFGPPSANMAIVVETSSKSLKVPPKKRPRHKKSKKPKDMPRRPLSAYSMLTCSEAGGNPVLTILHICPDIFFKEERSRLLKEIEDGNDILGTEGKSQGLFALMGKSIAKKWKSLTKEEMVKYTDAAKEDLKRYRTEMDQYQYVVRNQPKSANPVNFPFLTYFRMMFRFRFTGFW
jgi:HMG-box domain